jgi:hypothetical protein
MVIFTVWHSRMCVHTAIDLSFPVPSNFSMPVPPCPTWPYSSPAMLFFCFPPPHPFVHVAGRPCLRHISHSVTSSFPPQFFSGYFLYMFPPFFSFSLSLALFFLALFGSCHCCVLVLRHPPPPFTFFLFYFPSEKIRKRMNPPLCSNF